MREVVNRVTRPIFNYGQRFSPHPLHFGIMCCAIEMGQASAPDHDIDRLGVVYRSSPRQCDVLIVNGPVCEKLRPKLKTLYEQMPEPKWVIAMGECAISGGPYWDSYSVVAGADTFMPVDVYIPGCPVRPEALMHGFLTLQKKIREKEPDSHGQIRYGFESEPHNIEWEPKLKTLVLEKIEEMNDILEGRTKAHRNHKRVGKCNNCSRRKGCPERLRN